MSEKDISLTVADAFETVIDDKIDGHIRQDNTSHLAEVVRIDPDGTHWVHVYGGADLTPVTNLASTAQVGDVINVTISNNSILGMGNISSPAPTKTYVDKQNTGIIQIVGNAIGADLSGLSYKDGILKSEKVVTDKLQARVGEFQQAIAERLDVKRAAIEYAKIDAANITAAQVKTAWIDKLLVDTDLLAKEGTIFKLEAIEVDANKITAGTIDVNRLIYSETDSQGVTHSHLVTFQENPQTGQVEMVYEDDPNLQGSIIEDRTLTADKIVAGSITANEITAQNLQGIHGWINLTEGQFKYGEPEVGNAGISWKENEDTHEMELLISSPSLMVELSDIYSTKDELNDASNVLNAQVATVAATAEELSASITRTDANLSTITTRVIIGESGGQPTLTLNASGSDTAQFVAQLTNTELSFIDSGNKVAWLSNQQLHITDAEVTGSLQFGGFAFIPHGTEGAMGLKWVGIS